MDTHVIHLRGGWDYTPLDGPTAGPLRLTLPTRWGTAATGRLRLTRRFNRPPRCPDDRVFLRLRQAPGIHSIMMNGRAFESISSGRSEVEIEVGVLATRNVLILEIDPPCDDTDWGAISLIFVPSEGPTA